MSWNLYTAVSITIGASWFASLTRATNNKQHPHHVFVSTTGELRQDSVACQYNAFRRVTWVGSGSGG